MQIKAGDTVVVIAGKDKLTKDKKGNMEEILERKNFLIRPAVANVDQTLVIFFFSFPQARFLMTNAKYCAIISKISAVL